jgi:Resolvase, N terminal domain
MRQSSGSVRILDARLTRSLADFAKLVELFDGHGVSFVSVTQQFNTTTSMGRLTLNVLLSFAQFEREVTSERIRDKIAASKRKGLWVGGISFGVPPHRYNSQRREFEFSSKMLQSLMGVLFNEAVRRMVAAFEGRAKQLYSDRSSGATWPA